MHIGLFLNFGGSDRLDIAYDDSPQCFSTYNAGYSSCIINKVCIMCINCAHMHIGLFLHLGGSDHLNIAYEGSPKCFSTCSACYSSCIINKVCIMCINCAKKSQK